MSVIGVAQKELDYRKKASWFILASLFLHMSMMFIMSREWMLPRWTLNEEKAVDIEVVPMTKEQMARIKAQIAETELTKKADKAAEDAFLGQQTQVVQAQTKAQETAPFQTGKQGGTPTAKAQDPKRLSLGNLGVPMNFKPLGNLGPGQTAATSDYLKDVKQGAQTMLNTKEFAFFSYYQRVRRQLEQYWEPGLMTRLKSMAEKGRALATDQEHSTRILVVMDKEGEIKKVQVEGTSGLLDLDQAAIDAFNRAGPFPNPPHGMIDGDGTVKIEWEFILKT